MIPRQDTMGWEYDNRAYVPNASLPLTGGFFMLGNRMANRYDIAGTMKEHEYDWENPMRNTWYTPSEDVPSVNHGYGSLYREPEMSSRLKHLANEYNIPATHLADSVAMATQGRFFVSDQYGRAADKLSKFVVPKLEPVREVVGNAGAEYTAAALLTNRDNVLRLYEKPRLAHALNNGYITMQQTWDALGSHGGRVYDHANNFVRKLQWSVVHDDYDDDCAYCRSLRASGSDIVPHERQPIGG